MNKMIEIGKSIKDKRLADNLTMDYVASKAGISRHTLYSIEKGDSNISMSSLLNVLNALGLEIDIKHSYKNDNRKRASRTNTLLDKNINRFIVMCVEQFISFVNASGEMVYRDLLDRNLIKELEDDYEDLHGMSTVYINDYIHDLLNIDYLSKQEKAPEHILAKALLITKLTEITSKEYGIRVGEAREKLYKSGIVNLIEDDETGLYGESPLHVFYLYRDVIKNVIR